MPTDFAAVARLLANQSRSRVVDALTEGRPLAAGELARLAGVRPSTISEHLSALVDGGLLTVVDAGRHRYYELAGPRVAEALEALSMICPTMPVRSLRQASGARALRRARTCYDHLAGALGVALLDAMLESRWLGPDYDERGPSFTVSPAGADQLGRLGVDVEACRRSRRQFARPCLDWTQRRMHVAGALGAGIRTALDEQGWIRAVDTGRGLSITPAGVAGLRGSLGMDVGTL